VLLIEKTALYRFSSSNHLRLKHSHSCLHKVKSKPGLRLSVKIVKYRTCLSVKIVKYRTCNNQHVENVTIIRSVPPRSQTPFTLFSIYLDVLNEHSAKHLNILKHLNVQLLHNWTNLGILRPSKLDLSQFEISIYCPTFSRILVAPPRSLFDCRSASMTRSRLKPMPTRNWIWKVNKNWIQMTKVVHHFTTAAFSMHWICNLDDN